MNTISMKPISPQDRDQIRQIVLDASEPIAPFWPMRSMVAQNPLHGLEYLPFDQAVRKARTSLGEMGISRMRSIANFTEMAVLPKKVLSGLFLGLGLVQMVKLLLKLGVERFPQKIFGN